MHSRTQQPPAWLEVAAALLVPAACFGFSRVFIDSAAVLPIIGASLLSTAVALLTRRLGLSLLLSGLISGLLLALLVINRYAPGTSRLGLIPTSETVADLRLLTEQLVRDFRELQTPVQAFDPFLAAAMIGVWVMAFLTDWGALRLRLAFEPVLPAGLLFIFTSIPPISAIGSALWTSVAFAAAVALWAVAQRAANLMQRGVWLPGHDRRGATSVGRVGLALAAGAVVAGSLLGGQLPGADADAVYSFEDEDDPTRVVVSPFVNLKSRLVNQTSLELFQVTTDQRSYWRIAGLDTYEDDIWKVAGDFSPEDGRLPGQDLGGNRLEINQSFQISLLSEIWLPAAFAPAEISGATADVTWNAETSSLTVANHIPNSDGVQYQLVSSVPNFTAEDLQAADPRIPDDIAERYLQLPSLPAVVQQKAQEIAAGASTRYDQMLALQEHFREYDYNVDLSPREGDPIEQFLAEREGFCQQFAGTFALMARSLGVPARVATGFTWGDPIAVDTPSEVENGVTYSVTGRHTHAWPEVFFDGLGWVPFEPTPGRGLPNAGYTGHDANQDSSGQETAELPDVPTPTIPLDEQLLDQPPLPELDVGQDGDGGGSGSGGFPIPWRTMLVLGVVAAYAIGVPAARHFRKLRRRQRARTSSEQAETAWADASEAIELGYGLNRSAAETRAEFADRLTHDKRVPSEPMTDLAGITTVARFHPTGLTDSDADKALGLADQVEEAVKKRVPLTTRYKRLLDPRRLLKPTARIVNDNGSADRVHEPEFDFDRETVDA